MAAKARKRERRKKQGYLPGMEPPSIPQLDIAADTYYSAMTERQRLTQEEKDAKLNLQALMAEHKLERYETPDGLIVIYLRKEGCKCKKKKEPKAKPESNGESHEDGAGDS